MSVLPPLAAAASYPVYLVAMLIGFIIGTFGHVIHSTLVIVLGILIIGATSVAVLTAVSVS
jgi:hypothetical protein